MRAPIAGLQVLMVLVLLGLSPCGVAEEDSGDWRRMTELMELAGRSEEAEAASRRADVLANQEAANSGDEASAPRRRR